MEPKSGQAAPNAAHAPPPRKRSSLKNPSFRAATATASQNSLNEAAAAADYTEPYAQEEEEEGARRIARPWLRSGSASRSRDFLNQRSRSRSGDFLNQRSRSRSQSRDALIQVAMFLISNQSDSIFEDLKLGFKVKLERYVIFQFNFRLRGRDLCRGRGTR